MYTDFYSCYFCGTYEKGLFYRAVEIIYEGKSVSITVCRQCLVERMDYIADAA